jgi:hypothetical protein
MCWQIWQWTQQGWGLLVRQQGSIASSSKALPVPAQQQQQAAREAMCLLHGAHGAVLPLHPRQQQQQVALRQTCIGRLVLPLLLGLISSSSLVLPRVVAACCHTCCSK